MLQNAYYQLRKFENLKTEKPGFSGSNKTGEQTLPDAILYYTYISISIFGFLLATKQPNVEQCGLQYEKVTF